jgi:anti-sigma regulatory factor (Ser/Thr protein kinase)
MKAAETAWPSQARLELAATPGAVRCARGHVRAAAVSWVLVHLGATAELLASELVTNAIRASAGTGDPVRLWVTSDESSLRIHVWDSSQDMPVRKDPCPEQENGRGLLLVEALGSDWGVYRKSAGKVVWVQVKA